jgi:FXSXX-COOH protein
MSRQSVSPVAEVLAGRHSALLVAMPALPEEAAGEVPGTLAPPSLGLGRLPLAAVVTRPDVVGAVDPLPDFPEPHEEHQEPPHLGRYDEGVDDIQVEVLVPDLRGVPLGEIPEPDLAKVTGRVLPGRGVVTVAVAGFSSAL